MRDGPALRVVKRVALLAWVVDLQIRRAFARLRGEKPWAIAGQCQRSGQCCEAPTLEAGLITWSFPALRRPFLAWQRRVNGFELARVQSEGRLFVFRCTHYDRDSRSCDSYDSRPGVCRDYPRNLLWQANPRLHSRCGFRALPPNAKGLRSAIDALEITPAQREKLRRGLRLDG